MGSPSLADLEPVISDWSISVVEGRLRDRYRGVPDNTDFVSFIQPPKVIHLDDGADRVIPEMAVFAIISNHPTVVRAPRIMTHGTTTLRDFEEAVMERKQPEMIIFDSVLRTHLTTLENLRAIIH